MSLVGTRALYLHESDVLQHRKTGDDPPGPDWVAIPGPGGLVN